MPPVLLEPTKFAPIVSQVNVEARPLHLAEPMPMYVTQSRPESLNLRTKPEFNRRRRGPVRPKQPAMTPPRVNTQARSKLPRKLDSKAGLMVLGVPLVIMVFYGRGAAMIGLCICFYLAAIFRQSVVAEAAVREMVGASYADIDSEYKKRVVLEGLLDRVNKDDKCRWKKFR